MQLRPYLWVSLAMLVFFIVMDLSPNLLAANAAAQNGNLVYLPEVIKNPLPTPTRTPTRTNPGVPSATPTRGPTVTPPGNPTVTLHYTLNRDAVPALTYNDVTLKVYVGKPAAVTAQAGGQTIPIDYDAATGYALVSVSASSLDIHLYGGDTSSAQIGAYTKTALKDDRLWAWSHSFDDNVYFKIHGIPAFEAYGWRGTVYLIGDQIDDTRKEDWTIDKPDIKALVKKGWGIGNHSWSHSYVSDLGGANAAKQDVIRLANYLRQAVNEAGMTNYRLMSFAAPNFDSAYLPIILNLRDSGTTELMLDESGSDAVVQVDAGATGGTYPAFNLNQPIGRDWRIEEYGTNSADDQSFRRDVNSMIARLDASHHNWLNTFSHQVDDDYPNKNVFGFLTWVYNNYGPGGNNTVWVAPSEEIYSYLLVRDRVVVSYQRINH
jgi:hypothetical protein